MKKRKLDFVDTYEEGLTTLVVYLVMITEPKIYDYDLFHKKYFADKSINQLVADSLNRIERLRLNSATPLSDN
jgi:hypothetical protein